MANAVVGLNATTEIMSSYITPFNRLDDHEVAKRGTTETVTVSFLVGSACDVAVTSVVPAVSPAMIPPCVMVATDGVPDDHVTAVEMPGSAPTVAVNVVLVPGFTPTRR